MQLSPDRKIGDGELPFIIAEIGNNHNGDIQMALELIRIAKEIGVDAVKFQVKDVEIAFPKELLDSSYSGPNSFGKTYREHKQSLEFTEDQLRIIYEYAKKLNITCFSTPFDVNSVDLLENIGNSIYKISSFHVTDLKLIEKICKTGKPILMSTGLSTIDEIDDAVKLIKKYKNQFVLLHCISCYPTNDEDTNLHVISTLRKRYDCPIGYSGHERGTTISCASVVLGACVIERHFTLDRTLKGPDHASSVEPAGMKLIVDRTKRIFTSLGSSEKKVLDCELKTRKKFRGY